MGTRTGRDRQLSSRSKGSIWVRPILRSCSAPERLSPLPGPESKGDKRGQAHLCVMCTGKGQITARLGLTRGQVKDKKD